MKEDLLGACFHVLGSGRRLHLALLNASSRNGKLKYTQQHDGQHPLLVNVAQGFVLPPKLICVLLLFGEAIESYRKAFAWRAIPNPTIKAR
jgi:hypothetical protein